MAIGQGGGRGPGRAQMLAVLAVALLVASACNAAPTGTSSPSAAGSTDAPSSGGAAGSPASLPNGITQPDTSPYDAARLTQGADAELATIAAGRTDAAFVHQLGPNGSGVLDGIDAAMTQNGEAHLQEDADALGIDVTARAGEGAKVAAVAGAPGFDRPPRDAEWTGRMIGHAAGTLTMLLGLLTAATDLAATTGKGSEQNDETYTPTEAGISESVHITTTFALDSGGGKLSADVDVVANTNAKDATTGAAVGQLTGKAHGHIEVNACPDAGGLAPGRLSISSSEDLTNAAGASGHAYSFDGPFTLVDGDDAHLVRIESTFGMSAGAHGPAAADGSGAFNWGSSVSIPATITPGGSLSLDSSRATGQANGATDAQLQQTFNVYLIAYPILVELAKNTERFWRSGRCITLEPSEPGRDVDAGETVNLTVASHHAYDGAEVKAPIVAMFSGKASLDPSGRPVDEPASYTFIAGSDDGDVGTIDLRQTGKRGIGTASLTFTVNGVKHLRVTVSGQLVLKIPSLSQKLTVSGSVDISRTPGSSGLRGDGTLHVTFFHQALPDGCVTSYAGEIPVTIRVDPSNHDDAGLTPVRVSGPDVHYHQFTEGGCSYVDFLGNIFGQWAVGVGMRARIGGGPNTVTTPTSNEDYSGTATLTK